MSDLDGIAMLLQPLENKGILKQRTLDELQQELPNFVVIEREVRHAYLCCLTRVAAFQRL